MPSRSTGTCPRSQSFAAGHACPPRGAGGRDRRRARRALRVAFEERRTLWRERPARLRDRAPRARRETRAGIEAARALPPDASISLAAATLGSGNRVSSMDTVPFALFCATAPPRRSRGGLLEHRRRARRPRHDLRDRRQHRRPSDRPERDPESVARGPRAHRGRAGHGALRRRSAVRRSRSALSAVRGTRSLDQW